MYNEKPYYHKECKCNEQNHHSHDKCFDPCFNHSCSPFQARLAGIQGNISFQLFRLKGCSVKVHLSCPGKDSHVYGKICNVGTDFVDIRMDNEKDQGKVVTVMIEKICLIEWPDKNCSPCRKKECHDHNCDPCNY